jgi:hypothetical protein
MNPAKSGNFSQTPWNMVHNDPKFKIQNPNKYQIQNRKFQIVAPIVF